MHLLIDKPDLATRDINSSIVASEKWGNLISPSSHPQIAKSMWKDKLNLKLSSSDTPFIHHRQTDHQMKIKVLRIF